ncbi:TrkA C-terminal domain protein [Hallella bergensis DSM 17361]|uniref:TrkA C-terminal domain protein n=1 Tax=Hallella bergensis DSM 17361 TaxID=585502 RepID=D1PU25_9BACT|nr:putative transporter [Hallella bergensis]EFA45127.1 TrkA C-terminal domain protein [Hallella bergensis DSM 17361]
MDWTSSLFCIHSPLQTVIVISLVIALGLGLGRIKVMGISLGIAFVFFAGILAGHIGLSADAQTLDFIETFGLALFVYCLGLHVGPNFFGSFREEGMALNLWGLAVIVLGTVMALVLIPITGVSLPNMVGLLCGATTNTPALGAATQALEHIGISNGSAALATAVTYPLGVVGVILAMVFIRKFFVKPQDLEVKSQDDDNHTVISQLNVINPAVDGKTILEIVQMSHLRFVISRIWRGNEVIVPLADTVIRTNDSLLVVTNREDDDALVLLFGQQEKKDWNREKIDWNVIDSNVESRICVVTRRTLNGKRLGDLHMRQVYGVNVSRVIRGDIKLLASHNLRLQYGDRVTIVGKHEDVNNAEQFFGNSVKTLEEPNIGSIFFGLILGLAIGTIPIALPGMSTPVRLGIAGGPIMMGILVGALGPRMHFISYTTRSASLMLRKLGISLYLACLGLDAGKDFLSTVVRPEGITWVGIGFLLTVIPVLIIGIVALRTKKYDFGTICGILCGSMANPMALGYADDTIKGDTPSVSYATVYPLGMFIRVIIAQILIMFLA